MLGLLLVMAAVVLAGWLAIALACYLIGAGIDLVFRRKQGAKRDNDASKIL